MERMEHIHGKLLGDAEAAIVLDDVDGFLGCHAKKNGTKEYYGYFEMATERLAALANANRYKLVLDDGRSGTVYTEMHPANVPGKTIAEFHVSGSLRRF